MLQDIRENSQGIIAKVIIGFIVAIFALTGVEWLIGGFVASPPVAEVNGEEIAKTTLDRAYENERARMEAQYGDAFAALAADENYLRQFRQGILQRLIGDKLIEMLSK